MVAIAKHLAGCSFPFKLMLWGIVITVFAGFCVIFNFMVSNFPFKHFGIIDIFAQLKYHVEKGTILFDGKFSKDRPSIIPKDVLKIGGKLFVFFTKKLKRFFMEILPIESINGENIAEFYLCSKSNMHIVPKDTPIADGNDISGYTIVFGIDASIAF